MANPNAEDTIPASPTRQDLFVFCDASRPPDGVVVRQFPHPFSSIEPGDQSKIRGQS